MAVFRSAKRHMHRPLPGARSVRLLLAALVTSLAAVFAVSAQAQDDEKACSELEALTGFDFAIISTEMVAEDDILPRHCRALGFIQQAIHFEVRLPVGEAWNGKFNMVGNGGYQGRIFDQSYGLSRGYATASTDTGHQGGTPTFGLERAKEIDFAFRSIHLTAVAAKRVIKAYYGRPARLSYYRGCSTGGRQGLMEAQRFPGDFDGYSIGAPLYDFTLKQTFNAAWVAKALFGNEKQGYVPPHKLPALGKAVYDKCDAVDGLKDGLIDDPRRCDFQPARDLRLCPDGEDSAQCFTPAQITAIEKIYDGPGEDIYPGHVVGGEWMAHESPEFYGGWDLYFIGKPGDDQSGAEPSVESGRPDPYGGGSAFLPVQYRNGLSFFKYLAFREDDPDFDIFTDLDFDNPPDTSFMAAMMNATDPDLSAVRDKGAKIVMWHGWADVGLNPLRSIDYYEAVRAEMGDEASDEFFRLFMVPGMYHCAQGPGPDMFDDLAALENWVENGVKPDQMIAYQSAGDPGYEERFQRLPLARNEEMSRSRPLCPYPKIARHKGRGPVDLAENFICVAPSDIRSGE